MPRELISTRKTRLKRIKVKVSLLKWKKSYLKRLKLWSFKFFISPHFFIHTFSHIKFFMNWKFFFLKFSIEKKVDMSRLVDITCVWKFTQEKVEPSKKNMKKFYNLLFINMNRHTDIQLIYIQNAWRILKTIFVH